MGEKEKRGDTTLNTSGWEVPLEISARHVHLSPEDVEKLFGAGHSLTPKRTLSQPGEFLSEERVKIVTPKGEFPSVAVLGPARKQTQVELSATDSRTLGILAPLNMSGDLEGGADVCLLGAKGFVTGKAIIAQGHIHMTPEQAKEQGITNGQVVKIRAKTSRPILFENIVARVGSQYQLAVHLDFDEANACMLESGSMGELFF